MFFYFRFKGVLAHYSLAKAALNSYTSSLAMEMGPKGINVNLLTLGATITPGTGKELKKVTAAMGITLENG